MFYFCFLMNARARSLLAFGIAFGERMSMECAQDFSRRQCFLGLSFRLQSEERHPSSRDSRAAILGHTVH
jgi:hypothetical protein